MTNRAALVAHARGSISRGSKSFRAASRLFDPQTRERAWLLYAWCRACDDIADGQDHGGTMSVTRDPHARLAQIETLTDLVADNAGLLAQGADSTFQNKVHLGMDAKGFGTAGEG